MKTVRCLGGLFFAITLSCASSDGPKQQPEVAETPAADTAPDARVTNSVFGQHRLALSVFPRLQGGTPVKADGTLADTPVVMNTLSRSVEALGVGGPHVDWQLSTGSPVRTAPATYGVNWTSSSNTDKLAFAVYNTTTGRGLSNFSQLNNGSGLSSGVQSAVQNAAIFVLTNLYGTTPDLLTYALDGTMSQSFGNGGLIFNIAGDKLYALSLQGTLYCFAIPDGGAIAGGSVTSASACAGWTPYNAGASVTYSSPWPVYNVTTGEVSELYFGDDVGKLHRVSGSNGAAVWSAGALSSSNAALSAPILVTDSTLNLPVVYVGDNIGRFFRVIDNGATPNLSGSNIASVDLCGSAPGTCTTTPWAIRTSPTADLTYNKTYVASGGRLFEFPLSGTANWQQTATAKILVTSATQIMQSNPVIDYDNGWLYAAYNNRLYKVKYPFDGSSSTFTYATTLRASGPDASYPRGTPLAYNNLVYLGTGTGTDGSGISERYGCTGSMNTVALSFLNQTSLNYGAYVQTPLVLDWLSGNVNFGYENAAGTAGGLVQFKPSGSPDWSCPTGMTAATGSLCGGSNVSYCVPSASCCPTPAASFGLTGTATCSSSLCTQGCSTGRADCNTNKNSDGCETTTTTDVSNCGACGNSCSTNNTTPTCASGVCNVSNCSVGYANCNGSVSDGCEAPVTCGSCCGATCGGAQVCSGGTCSSGSNTVCATVSQNQTATLTCPSGTVIQSVTFASYGTPTGSCSSFATSSCNSATSTALVRTACLNQSSCSVPATNANFGDPCSSLSKRLYIQVACSCPGAPGVSTAVTATTNATVSTYAGSGTAGTTNGAAANARFRNPFGLVFDGASSNLFVGDEGNQILRGISLSPVIVSTFSGNGVSALTDGAKNVASFNNPDGLAVDALGNVYTADSGNNAIRQTNPSGTVTTLAGNGTAGYSNGTGTAALFNGPQGVAADTSGNLYVADTLNHAIRKIVIATGVVTTFAGSTTGVSGRTDATGTAARFNGPQGIAIDTSGNLYVADTGNNSIRRVTSAGVVTTLAGSTAGASGTTNGIGTAARFNSPRGIAVNGFGNLFVADFFNNSVRQITLSNSAVITYAGSTAGTSGMVDSTTSLNARFSAPAGIATDASNNLYVADYNNHRIRQVTSSRAVTVAWTAPALNGGSAITSYTVTATASGQPTATCTATTTTNCVVSSLTAGATYSVTVTATNANGTGTASTPTVVTP